jgi:predicted nucleotidyltransferase
VRTDGPGHRLPRCRYGSSPLAYAAVTLHMRDHRRIVEAATRWAERDARVRALLLKGSLARGDADERSDVDLVAVSKRGQLESLWDDRGAIAEGLGDWLGGFDEVAWQQPHTFIGFYDGPVKVDFFFQEDEPAVDPWLRDGFRALFDPNGLADRLGEQLRSQHSSPDLSDFDVHAWDWLWAVHLKLRHRGNNWLVYVELVKFAETMLVAGFNALSAEPWRGVSRIAEQLPIDAVAQLRAAIPASPERLELQRAQSAALDCYLQLRRRLADELSMPLAERLAAQVLPILRSTAAPSDPA